MPMTAVDASTPNYVLIDGTRRIGPTLVPLGSGLECSAIYGFSAKGPYDTFCANSQQALKPYPLVKGYLRNQLDAPDNVKFVVIDAASPNQPYLHAATIQAVLEAQENRAAHVNAAHRLTFDDKAHAYRVDEQ